MSTENIESVTLTQTERVVVNTDQGKVIVTGVIGPRMVPSINNSYDVDITNLVDGATLIYSDSTLKWHATNLLEKQIMEGGQY